MVFCCSSRPGLRGAEEGLLRPDRGCTCVRMAGLLIWIYAEDPKNSQRFRRKKAIGRQRKSKGCPTPRP